MLKPIYRTLCALLVMLSASSAQALFALPPGCQFDPFAPACVPDGQPIPASTSELIGSALFAKLQGNAAYSAQEELAFVDNWVAAWLTFPVPLAIEQQIEALDPNDLDAWLDWLCSGLQANGQEPAINFQQAPQLVIDSFSAANTAAVPIPAAGWLFASAVIGLAVGGKRRH